MALSKKANRLYLPHEDRICMTAGVSDCTAMALPLKIDDAFTGGIATLSFPAVGGDRTYRRLRAEDLRQWLAIRTSCFPGIPYGRNQVSRNAAPCFAVDIPVVTVQDKQN